MAKDKGNTDEPAYPINLAGTMPPKPANGLNAIYQQMVESPGDRRVAVVEFDCLRYTVETDTGEVRIVVRFRQIEPLSGEAAKTAHGLLDEAQAARTGQFTYPQDDGVPSA